MAKQPTKDKPEQEPDKREEVFMREVDEAVRQDELQSFFTRYGLAIGGVLFLTLAGVAGWIFWQNSQAEQSGVRSEEYVAAVDSIQQDNLDGAKTALGPLADAEQEGYRAMAKLMTANIAVQEGEEAKALELYEEVASDEDLPEPFRQLALVRQTAIEYDNLNPQQVIDRMKPIAVTGNPWFGSAGEMVALAYLAQGKENLAGPLFAEIAGDEGVPPTIRSRAVQMAGLQGIDASLPGQDDDGVADDAAPAPVTGAATAQGDSSE